MLKPISRRELIKKLKALGFDGPSSGGKHQYMMNENFKIFVPNPHGKDIGTVLLQRIIKELGVTAQKFLEL